MSTTDSDLPILHCPACRIPLNVNRTIERLEDRCPVCRGEVSVTVFPRLYSGGSSPANSKMAVEGEARCSFFPELLAEKVCDECGCFMSNRAAAKWGDQDLCLPCLHRLREEVKSPPYVARARLHDNRAFLLVTLLAPFGLITAPLAIFLLLRHRRDSEAFEPRSRARWCIAMILAIGWILMWIVLLVVWTSVVIEDFT